MSRWKGREAALIARDAKPDALVEGVGFRDEG